MATNPEIVDFLNDLFHRIDIHKSLIIVDKRDDALCQLLIQNDFPTVHLSKANLKNLDTYEGFVRVYILPVALKDEFMTKVNISEISLVLNLSNDDEYEQMLAEKTLYIKKSDVFSLPLL
jgi:hypothetical protein